MDILKTMLPSLPLLLVTVAVECRFVSKTMGRKTGWVLTYCALLLGYLVVGGLNLRYRLAYAIGTNTISYCIITFFLYLLLFQGSVVKKLFFAILISYGIPIMFYVFMPFVSWFFALGSREYLRALQMLEYVNIACAAVLLEYVGKRFQNLRRELPTGYTLYLTIVLLFVHVAVFAGYDVLRVRNEGDFTLLTTLAATAFAIVGNAIVLTAIFAVDRQVDVSLKAQFTAMQVENFRSRELQWRRLSRFRHDLKNHLLCLQQLLENGQTQQAASYMQNLTDAVRQMDSPVQTGNAYADALLSVKHAEACEAGITVSLDLAIPAQGDIRPVDLCSILSNAFDNAIAACRRLPEGQRWITARAFVKQGQFVFELKNSKPPCVTVVGGEVSPKEITADHGIGLDTVKAIVQQYGGTLHLSAEDAFLFSVLLPQNRL